MVGTARQRRLDHAGRLQRQGAVADNDSHFAVLQLRAQVKVHGADHQQTAIRHHHFGMQAGAGAVFRAACRARAGTKAHDRPFLLGAHFIDFNAHFQQRFTVAGVPHVRGRCIVRGQRIGQHPHPDAAPPYLGKLAHHAFARHKVGRNDQQIGLGLRHELQQAIHGCFLRFFYIVGIGGNLGGLIHQQNRRCPGPGQQAQVGRVGQLGKAFRDAVSRSCNRLAVRQAGCINQVRQGAG